MFKRIYFDWQDKEFASKNNAFAYTVWTTYATYPTGELYSNREAQFRLVIEEALRGVKADLTPLLVLQREVSSSF